MILELNADLQNQVLSNAVQEATDAFWASISQSYPHIKTGDLDPGSVFALEQLAEKTVRNWLMFNEPGTVLPDTPDSLVAERVAKAKVAFKGYEFFSDDESHFLCQPISLSNTWSSEPEHCVSSTLMDTRDASGKTLNFVVEFCPGTTSIKSATAYAQDGSVVGEDMAVRFYNAVTPDDIAAANVGFEEAHAVKWELMSQGVLTEVTDSGGNAIPEVDAALAAQDRLCRIIADLIAQGRDFHLDDDPAEIVSADGYGDEGRIFNDAEADFLRTELSAIRTVIGNDQLWDTASPFLGLGGDVALVEKKTSGPRFG